MKLVNIIDLKRGFGGLFVHHLNQFASFSRTDILIFDHDKGILTGTIPLFPLLVQNCQRQGTQMFSSAYITCAMNKRCQHEEVLRQSDIQRICSESRIFLLDSLICTPSKHLSHH